MKLKKFEIAMELDGEITRHPIFRQTVEDAAIYATIAYAHSYGVIINAKEVPMDFTCSIWLTKDGIARYTQMQQVTNVIRQAEPSVTSVDFSSYGIYRYYDNSARHDVVVSCKGGKGCVSIIEGFLEGVRLAKLIAIQVVEDGNS